MAAYQALPATAKAGQLRIRRTRRWLEGAAVAGGGVDCATVSWLAKRSRFPMRRWCRNGAAGVETGTSYGYRDGAIGVNARYLIGIWTGRPDGTPVVGQVWFRQRGAIAESGQ